ncbi:MAG TPA: hypothetical protein ENK08_11890 [Chloroflexi bacterium]|nr:hypothetical protein [Chloroflexota bacterium]
MDTQREHRKRTVLSLILPLYLGISLALLLAFLTRSPSYGAVPIPSSGKGTATAPTQDEVWYTRTQTVILHEPSNREVFATIYTTTSMIRIDGFKAYDPFFNWFRLPSGAVTHTATCTPTVPSTGTCRVIWNDPTKNYTPNVVFSGTGLAEIYLEYDAQNLASRDPSGPTITLQYKVGPSDPNKQFILSNTILFPRSLYGAEWYPIKGHISPAGYTYDRDDYRLSWSFTRTSRVTFTVLLREPLLGSDLVVEDIQMSPTSPNVGDPVRFTVTVRNIGPYTTGRPILAELFVRPVISGPPTVLTDHYGGWMSYFTPTLVKWPPLYGESDYWYAGLGPGEAVTGTTVFTWQPECAEPCDVWVKVDPTYIQLGVGYEWYGQNPEGFLCALDSSLQPTCPEENNNLRAYIQQIYLPLVMRNR